MKHGIVLRIRVISLLVCCAALVLIGRLYVVQIVYGDALTLKADRQYLPSGENLFERGSIFFEDKNGKRIAAATVKSGFTVALNPMNIQDPEALYRALAPLLPLNEEDFLFRARKADDPYEEIAKQVSEETARSIESLTLTGVSLYKERWRFYPGERLAAQTIGFVGYDDSGTKLAGRYGLERFYERILSRDVTRLYVKFFAEIFKGLGNELQNGETGAGGDIITTIEPSVELMLEGTLKKVSEQWHPTQVGGIIMNPQNGEIYAMGVYPNFNLNQFRGERDPRVFSNPLVEGVYEMGSIVKPLTFAAGLDAEVITATTTYHDYGFLELNGEKISNFDGKGRGIIPLQEVLNQSLNTGAAFVERQLGNKRFADYFLSFGLGEETGIDLPNEAHGIVENLRSPRDIEYATASFGQGIAITPVEAVRALSALANGGVLVTPHLAKTIKYENGFSKTLSYRDGVRVLKPETSEEITRMLVEVVDKVLGGGTAKLTRYSIAAKTGTAQIAKEDERGYYTDRYLHSFFGYFPAYDARFLIFFYALEPQGGLYASQTFTVPFMDTVKFLINYYEVSPNR